MIRDDKGMRTMGQASLAAMVTDGTWRTMFAFAITEDACSASRVKLGKKRSQKKGQPRLLKLTTVGSLCSFATDSEARRTVSMAGIDLGGTYRGASSFLDFPRVLRTDGGKRGELEEGTGIPALALALPLFLLLLLGTPELVR